MTDDEIEALKRKNRELEARLEAMKKRQESLIELIIGPQREMSEDDVEHARNYFDRLEELEDSLGDVERSAKAAIAETNARSDGGQLTKKDIARREGRDELVRRAAVETGEQHKLPLTKIIEQARPQTELAYQTVKDAAYELQTNWSGITVGDDEHGQRVLRINADEVSQDLAVTVEEDLGRDDLAKRLISKTSREGAKR